MLVEPVISGASLTDGKSIIQQKTDVTIVGGGPVGLLLALLLGKQGHSICLFDASESEISRSMAIGITPPSLDILATLGLDQPFIETGLKLTEVIVHECNHVIGRLRFDQDDDRFPFILLLPQAETIKLLRAHAATFPNVHIHYGRQVIGIESKVSDVDVRVRVLKSNQEHTVQSSLVAVCDGAHGAAGSWLGIQKRQRRYSPFFKMADYIDHSPLGREAHLFFGADRPVESFPLPGGKRRWIMRCGWNNQSDVQQPFEEIITDLTGIALNPEDKLDESSFQPQWVLADTFYHERAALCGDAAHVMSPIGGQGMNIGFGDAYCLAKTFHTGMNEPSKINGCFLRYEQQRKRVFCQAAKRAARGMRLGTLHGRVGSCVRKSAIQLLLGTSPIHRMTAQWFSMRSLPDPIKQYERIGSIQRTSLPLWPDLSRRWNGVELMDDVNGDEGKLLRTIRQFHKVNRLVSRYRSILTEYVLKDMLINPGKTYHLIDLGAGGCDIPVWLLQQAQQHMLSLRVTALDGDARIVHYAKHAHQHVSGLDVQFADILSMDQFGPADYVFTNHVVHHLPDEMIPDVIRKIHQITTRRWIISDLYRSGWAYAGFQIFGRFFRNSFTFEDGKRSICRGFVRSDMARYVQQAGVADQADICRRMPGRILVIGSKVSLIDHH